MIYFDNAATSFPKPEAVCEEVNKCMRLYCGNPGRGAHAVSLAASQKVFECREAVSALFGCPETENLIFTLNTTSALNMAIKGMVRRGDHIIISDLEHNSVFRPVYRMAENRMIEYDVFHSVNQYGRRPTEKICAEITKLIKPNTKLLICTHTSNICPITLPIREIGALCHRHNIIFIVDAAQSAGHIPVNMRRDNIDILCAPGHKGLLGPAGCGIMALGTGILPDTLFEGGNGINSLEGTMPDFTPERFETGTLPVPAIAGLLAGVQLIGQTGIDNIKQHEFMLGKALYDRLNTINGIKIYASHSFGPIILFNLRDIPSDTLAKILNERGICVRSGFHCSPLAHKALGTPSDGAVRVSLGIYNTIDEVDRFYKELKEI